VTKAHSGGPTGDSSGSSGWPAARTEIRKISEIRLNPDNPRRHSLEQIEQIARSLREFKWTIPVLIDETGMLLAGHGRVRAARLMGWTECPVVVAGAWSEEQKAAYMVADNALTDRSDWDPKLIRGTLRGLKARDFDLGLVGFSEEELARLMVDPMTLAEAAPKEVVMEECPMCGSRKRKIES
jgi:ParB-like chromosome segregation protein Spo0J